MLDELEASKALRGTTTIIPEFEFDRYDSFAEGVDEFMEMFEKSSDEKQAMTQDDETSSTDNAVDQLEARTSALSLEEEVTAWREWEDLEMLAAMVGRMALEVMTPSGLFSEEDINDARIESTVERASRHPFIHNDSDIEME
jgi:hypothetical protein